MHLEVRLRCLFAIPLLALLFLCLPVNFVSAARNDLPPLPQGYSLPVEAVVLQQEEPFDWTGDWAVFVERGDGSIDESWMLIERSADGSYQVTFEVDLKEKDPRPGYPTERYEKTVAANDSYMLIILDVYYNDIHAVSGEIFLQRTANPDQLSGQQEATATHVISGNELGWNVVEQTHPIHIGPLPFCAARSGASRPATCLAAPPVEGVVPPPPGEQPTALPTATLEAVLPAATELVETPAGFTVTIGCYDRVTSEENIACTATIYPDESLAEAGFSLTWYVDGAVAAQTAGAFVTDSLSIPPLPPGYHEIEVQVTSSQTSAVGSAFTTTYVTAADNPPAMPPAAPPAAPSSGSGSLDLGSPVSPLGQAAAAAGTLALLAAWLWSEYQANSHGYQQLQETLGSREEQAAAERRDWFDQQTSANQDRRRQELAAQGYVYDAAQDLWLPGPGHPDYDQAIIRQQVLQAASINRQLIEGLPPRQQVYLDELIDRLTYDGDLDLHSLEGLAQVRHAVNLQLQGQTERELAAAEEDLAWANLGEQAVQYVQIGSAFVAVTAVGGTFIFNPAYLAAFNGELAAIGLLGNVTAGAAGGYCEGGLGTALHHVAQNTLPINTLEALFDPQATWGQVGWGAVRDVGNTFTLLQGGSYLHQNLVAAAPSSSGGLIDDLLNPLSSSSDDVANLADDAGLAGTAADDLAAAGDDAAAAGQQVADDVLASQHADDLNEIWRQQRELGQQKIDRLQALVDEYNHPATSGVRRNELEGLMNQAATEIKADYQATNLIKYNGNSELQGAFNTEIRRTYNQVDRHFVNRLNQQGVRIGGRPVSLDDFAEIRNQSSMGTPGMDRDLASLQGSSQITVNGQNINNAQANQLFQQTYNQSYAGVTGTSADDALQTVTWDQHVEAFADRNVLQNDPLSYPFQAGHAAQTASVNVHKANHLLNMVKEGRISEANAIQEICRGTSKEIHSKIGLLASGSSKVPPDKLHELLEIRNYLGQVGRGQIPPGTAAAEIQQKFGTDLQGLVERVGGVFEMLIKG